MAFFKFRWPGRQQPAGDSAKPSRRASQPRSSQAAPSVEDMRRRARHRLIGAAVLVGAGVVGFPLLFDSQPRPVPVNVAIDIPDRNKVAPLVLPQGAAAPDHRASAGLVDGEELVAAPQRSARPAADAPAASQPPQEAARSAAVPAPKADAAAPRPEPKAEPKPPVRPEAKPESRPEPKPEPRPEPKAEPKPELKPEAKPEPKSVPAPARSDDASRARALLEGRSPVPTTAATPARADNPEAGRFIVQVGAFADADKAREVRDKLERSGLKTYTQVVETKDGSRTRVRIGPFASRAEADRAAERAKGAGLPGTVLSL